MTREEAVLTTLVVYKLGLLVLGWVGSRRTKDDADFYLGGRGLSPLVAAVSSAASSSSAWTLLGVSGAAYAWGVGALWLFPACVGGFALNWYVLAPGLQRLSRDSGALTVTGLLAGEGRDGTSRAVRIVASVILLGSLGFYVCSQLQAAGKSFEATFDLDPTASVLIGAAIVLVYTLAGGFWAVSLTDTLQGLLMAGAAVLLPTVALVEVGGPGELWAAMGAVDVPGFTSLTRHYEPAAGVGFIAGLLGVGLGYPGQPHVVNRFMALRDDPKALVAGRRIAMAWAVSVYAGMLLLGWSGRVLLAELPDGETVFVALANELLSPVMAGIVLAAVLSAIMSTADSQLLVAGSAVTHDLGLAGTSHRTMLLRSRLTVFALMVGAAVAAVTTDESIFRLVLFAWGAMGAAFGPLLLVTALRGPVSRGRTLVAMIVGAGLSITAYYGFPDAEAKALERVFPFVVVFAILLMPGGRRTSD